MNNLNINIIRNLCELIILESNKKYDSTYDFDFLSIGRSYLFEYEDSTLFDIITNKNYNSTLKTLIEENVVLVEGRLSIREDEPVKIVASLIKDLNENQTENVTTTTNKINCMCINITELSEDKKERLRGAIKFFSGDRANVRLEILQDGVNKPCGGIYMTNQILEQFEEIVGKENIELK